MKLSNGGLKLVMVVGGVALLLMAGDILAQNGWEATRPLQEFEPEPAIFRRHGDEKIGWGSLSRFGRD